VIEVGGTKRDREERAVAGLDGVLSIDLGRRGRRIRQKGVLRARSEEELTKKVSAIWGFADGREHKLVAGSEEFECVRMDSFEVKDKRQSGTGPVADYEVVYTQLGV